MILTVVHMSEMSRWHLLAIHSQSVSDYLPSVNIPNSSNYWTKRVNFRWNYSKINTEPLETLWGLSTLVFVPLLKFKNQFWRENKKNALRVFEPRSRVSRFDSCPNSFGISPAKSHWKFRGNSWKIRENWPDSIFVDRSRRTRSDSSLKLVGILPENSSKFLRKISEM
jgi:hypothetical protein